jgi:hypothetical protein
MITPSFNLTATERVLPRLALDFTTASLDSRITFTRALNTATRVNSSGFIEIINANLPRFDFNPITLACKGLLIEESRINLAQYSEDLQSSTGVWGLTSCTATANDVDAPDGTLSAEKLTATGNFPRIAQTITLADNTNYTISIFVKKGDAYVFSLFATNKANTTTQTFFNVDAGTVTSGTGTIEPYKNGFYRCSMTFSSASGATTPVLRFVNNAQGVTGGWSGTNYLYAWGAQFETGAFATSYIPNLATGTTTRNADVATMTGTNFSNWYNATEGTFVAQYIPKDPAPSGARGLFTVDDVTINNQIGIAYTSNLRGVLNIAFGGSGVAALTTNLGVVNQVNQVAGAYKNNDYASALNAGAVATNSTFTVPAVTRALIGFQFRSGLYANAHIQKLAFYPVRGVNAQVQAQSK